jgi:phosphoglycerate dehydrogenase-like enzyme
VSASRPRILVTEGSEPAPLAWLKERADVIEAAVGSGEYESSLGDAQGMVVRTYTRVNDALLEHAPKLKVVGRGGVGLENIDVAACRRRGVEVVYTPDANTLAVADFVFGYMLQLLRPWQPFSDVVYPPVVFKKIRDTVRGRQLNELTLGILGMGRVGRRVGHIGALGFGMRVIYNDLLDVAPQLDFPATAVDKPTLYQQADVLSIHVDGRRENKHLVNAAVLSQLRPTSILINTSRGEVLDAAALADALKSNKIYAAALDVYDPEPPPEDFPLLGLPNALLTPHLAARTQTALDNMSWVVKDVLAVLAGERPRFPAP